jgi:hypothetical protein
MLADGPMKQVSMIGKRTAVAATHMVQGEGSKPAYDLAALGLLTTLILSSGK